MFGFFRKTPQAEWQRPGGAGAWQGRDGEVNWQQDGELQRPGTDGEAWRPTRTIPQRSAEKEPDGQAAPQAVPEATPSPSPSPDARNLPARSASSLTAQEFELVRSGHKVKAVKAYMDRTGADPAAAKAVFEDTARSL